MALRCSSGREQDGRHATDEHKALALVEAKKRKKTRWLVR